MLETLRTIKHQGYQAIRNVRTRQTPQAFRGFPVLSAGGACPPGCGACERSCLAGALSLDGGLCVDLGKCTFCGDCTRACPGKGIAFSNFHWTAADAREKLQVRAGQDGPSWRKDAVAVRAEVKRMFGRSLKLRQVSAGGCNGCELELNACGNVNFDMGRFGVEFVASPRHADAVVITGPVTENMAFALEETFRAIPEPKLVIAVGTCAISGGVFAGGAVARGFLERQKPDLFVPGCPVHPLTFINGILDFTRGR